MFSLFVRQEEFSEAIQNIIATCEQTRGAEKGGSLPHFFYIKIEGLGNALRLSAQNMTRRVEVILKQVSEHSPFCAGVSGIHLKNLIAAMPKGMISVDFTEGCTVSSDKSQYYLNTVPSDTFPPPPAIEAPFVPVDFEALLGSFSKISYCASLKDNPKPYVKSICILPQHIVCTDNSRLSYVPNTFVPLEDTDPILLPVESAKILASLFKNEAVGQMSISKNMVCFRTDKISVLCRLYSDKAPNFKSVIDQRQSHSHIIASSDELKAALKRLTSFMMSSDLTKTTPGIFEFAIDKLKISVEVNGYKAEEIIEVQKGFSVKLNLNLVYVYQAIRHIHNGVYFGIRGPELPLSIEDETQAFINILMPMKSGR